MLADLDVHVWRLQESLARLSEASAILEHASILASCRYHHASAIAFEYQAVNENRAADFELAIQHNRAALYEMEVIGDHRFSGKIENDIFDFITVEASVNARNATGGTARSAVEHEIQRAREGK